MSQAVLNPGTDAQYRVIVSTNSLEHMLSILGQGTNLVIILSSLPSLPPASLMEPKSSEPYVLPLSLPILPPLPPLPLESNNDDSLDQLLKEARMNAELTVSKKRSRSLSALESDTRYNKKVKFASDPCQWCHRYHFDRDYCIFYGACRLCDDEYHCTFDCEKLCTKRACLREFRERNIYHARLKCKYDKYCHSCHAHYRPPKVYCSHDDDTCYYLGKKGHY